MSTLHVSFWAQALARPAEFYLVKPDKFLPPFAPRQELDPAIPVSLGAMVGPEAFTEVR